MENYKHRAKMPQKRFEWGKGYIGLGFLLKLFITMSTRATRGFKHAV